MGPWMSVMAALDSSQRCVRVHSGSSISSILLPLSVGKGHSIPPPPSPSAEIRKSLVSLDRIDIQSKCQRSWSNFLQATCFHLPPVATTTTTTTSRTVAGLVSADGWRPEPFGHARTPSGGVTRLTCRGISKLPNTGPWRDHRLRYVPAIDC